MRANNFHLKGEAMKEAKQCTLPLRQPDYRKRIREERRPELVRLLAELLLQAFTSENARPRGAPWKR